MHKCEGKKRERARTTTKHNKNAHIAHESIRNKYGNRSKSLSPNSKENVKRSEKKQQQQQQLTGTNIQPLDNVVKTP